MLACTQPHSYVSSHLYDCPDVSAALVNAHGRDDKANLPMDEVYRRGRLLQYRYDLKREAYKDEVYEAAPKAATHDYQGTAGNKLVISTQLLQQRSTRAMQVCSAFEEKAAPGPYSLDYDVSAEQHADGQVCIHVCCC